MEKLNLTPINKVSTSESWQERPEHSRNIEDAERQKAVESLVDIGMLIRASDKEMYHGRVRRGGEKGNWSVDPDFKNGGNDTDNKNFNNRPTLYVGDQNVALEFANRRLEKQRQKGVSGGSIELHEIATYNPDAMILDGSFDWSRLSYEDQRTYFDAMPKLVDAPVLSFEDRDADINLAWELASKGYPIESIAERSRLSAEGYQKTLDYYDTWNAFSEDPVAMANIIMGSNGSERFINGQGQERNIDPTVAFGILRNANIIGVAQTVKSGTLGREVDIISLFDTQEVNEEGEIVRDRYKRGQKLGHLALSMGEIVDSSYIEQGSGDIIDALNQTYVKPEQLVESASRVSGFENVFDMSSGVWEGYTVREHTETVLRNFDENYANKVPVSILPALRLAMITHDIGKGFAAAEGRRAYQSEYNARYAKKFMEEVGIDYRTQQFISSVTGIGQELMHDIVVKSKSLEERMNATIKLRDEAARLMAEISNRNDEYINQKEIEGYMRAAEIIWSCDAGSYTDMAITRDHKTGNRYRNSPSFNRMFVKPDELRPNRLEAK